MYTMRKSSKVGEKGVKEVSNFLLKNPKTIELINVELDSFYQRKDIDLIHKRTNFNGDIITKTIEVKTDTQGDSTGNYCFETMSNVERRNLGWAFYCEADYLYYYFINTKELHIINMPNFRKWFEENNRYRSFRRADTKTYWETEEGMVMYTTANRLIKITELKSIMDIQVIKLKEV